MEKAVTSGARTPAFLNRVAVGPSENKKSEHTRSLASWRKKINSKGLRPWREFILLLGGN